VGDIYSHELLIPELARLQTDPVLAALQRAQDAMATAAGEPAAQVHDIEQRRRNSRRSRR
jgi:hypothetical protein